MSKAIDVSLSQVRFPSTCVVCMSPASKQYTLEKTFSMGRRPYTVKVNIPMCDPHFEAASFRGTAEKMVGMLGVIGEILTERNPAQAMPFQWQWSGGFVVLDSTPTDTCTELQVRCSGVLETVCLFIL